MALAGLCGVCGRPGAVHTCRACGGIVCGAHYIAAKGTCTPCSRGGGG